MVTVYLYTKKKGLRTENGFAVVTYEVVKSTGATLTQAHDRAESYAREKNIPLAGGYFTAKAKPYDFNKNYKVIIVPKGYRAKKKKRDMVDKIMDYEQGNLDNDGILDLFSELIKTGQVWKLQGHYGRQAKMMIDEGYISKTGKILKRVN